MISKRFRENIRNVWNYIDICIYFFSKEFVQFKKKGGGEYFKKNNPRRNASITFLIIENRGCYTFAFHVSANAISETERASVQKKSSFFFPPRRKETSPSPSFSLSPRKKERKRKIKQPNQLCR